MRLIARTPAAVQQKRGEALRNSRNVAANATVNVARPTSVLCSLPEPTWAYWAQI